MTEARTAAAGVGILLTLFDLSVCAAHANYTISSKSRMNSIMNIKFITSFETLK